MQIAACCVAFNETFNPNITYANNVATLTNIISFSEFSLIICILSLAAFVSTSLQHFIETETAEHETAPWKFGPVGAPIVTPTTQDFYRQRGDMRQILPSI